MNNLKWNVLRLSLEQIAVLLTLTILSLVSLNFFHASHLEQQHETRFLFSAIILGLSAFYLRFGVHQINALHQAGYRIAVVMMVWAVGLYFFPYPNTVLYLVMIPGFYFLFRIEIKKEKSTTADKTAAGLLFLLAVFLYVQQQPLQTILFENNNFNWNIYYLNAPGMILVGIALIRFQKWLHWDGIASIGTLVLIISATLTCSLLNNRLPFNELFFIAIICHALLAFNFIPNAAFEHFKRFSGFTQQNLDYPKSIYAVTFFLTQLSLLILLESYWVDSPLTQTSIVLLDNLNFLNVNNISLLMTLILLLSLPAYNYRQWSISFILFEAALAVTFLVLTGSLLHLSPLSSIIALIIVAALLAGMVGLKRHQTTSRWINNWSFSGVLACYALIFFHTPMFTPFGLIGFLTPVLAWGLLPDKPLASARRYETYFWPVASLIITACFSHELSLVVLSDWSLLTIAAPLVLTLAMSNSQLQSLIQQRGWHALHIWEKQKEKLLAFYSLFTLSICIINFLANLNLFESDWEAVIKTIIGLLLSASAMLYSALHSKKIRFILLSELILWLTMALIRWKLESLKILQLGTPIDGYIFISVAVIVAGVREKLHDNNQHLKSYFIKSSIVYSLIGWLYLIYLHLTGAQALHGELASILMAGLYYWLSRSSHKGMKIFVFIFANVALFLFFIDHQLNNLLVYLIPALGSALLLTQMFKEELSDFQVRQIRLICGLILLGVSAAYNILDFRASLWYPASAAIISAFVVVLGISLRIRIFLYLGGAFILINIIGMIANVIITQPPEKTMFAVGILLLAMGILFVASYLLFQMKREEIRQKYLALTQTIEKWE